ncbi:SLo interacting protein 1 isoform X2 [Megachile rotundata]|uniref:SLo interacting protein 1 isoform X2 n=1 Tax=Megachile rotundata TaxID=143995 RepID=UPI003FD00571
MDFVILKVNGQDVSNSSHEDAVRCFQSAQEPIVVEVLRRQSVVHGQRTAWKEQERNEEKTIEANKREQQPVNVCPTLVSTAVQTDWAGLLEEAEEEMSLDANDQPNDAFEHFLAHDIDFEEVTLRKTGSAEKLGLTVCYSSGSGSEDADTEVYISEIVPESVAARDGRLREGDQILRVNGKDVANKEQTENLFAETKNAVTILVSRCLYQGSPSFSPDHLPSYQNSLIEQLIRQQQQQTEERTKETEQDGSSFKPPPPVPSHTGSTTIVTVATAAAIATTTTAATTVITTTATTSSSSTCSSLNSQKSGRNATSPARQTDHDRKQIVPEALKDCSKRMEGLCLRSSQQSSNSNCAGPGSVKLADAYSNHAWNETEHIYETIPESDSEPIYSSPYEHRHWPQSNHCVALATPTTAATVTATATTTLTTTPTVTAFANASLPITLPITTISTTNASVVPTIVPQIGRWYCSSKSNSSGEEKDSSSAYNTGESCNSNPLTLELQRGERDHHKSTLVLCPPKTPTAQQQQQRLACTCLASANKQTKSQSTRRGSGAHHFRDRGIVDPTTTNSTTTTTAAAAAATTLVVATTTVTATATLPADTMYTNMANLQQTMLLQQQLFKRALDRRNSTVVALRDNGGTAKKSRSHGNFQAPNLTRYQFIGSQQVCASSPWVPPEGKGNDVQMEWKVKRRADGTRYIARRPVRNRILRNRAIKISEERAGHSTEDDTMSEAKIGRYWTKEERKRQLERARERKQRQQELMLQHHHQQQQLQSQQTNQLLICEHGDEKIAKKPFNILELSHKKMARKKNALDDFTTVQEMLVHGNRVGGTAGSGTGGKLMGLLSVTTV